MSKQKKENITKKSDEKKKINFWKMIFSVLIIIISAGGSAGIAFGISQAKEATSKQAQILDTQKPKDGK